MTPEIAEKGTVIRLDGDSAVIMLEGNKACKGCGAAKMGLCKPNGGLSIICAKNSLNAGIGDTVNVGIDSGVRLKGYFFSFMIPLFSFLGGSLGGYFIGQKLFLSELDVIVGFSTLILVSVYSFKRLKALDKSASLVIEKIVAD